MDNAERVAAVDDPDDLPNELRGAALAVVALLGYNAVQEVTAGAELHDDVHEELVLVCAVDADGIGVIREVVHDLDLAVDVQELALGDGHARVLGAVGLAHALVRGAAAALPLAQLLPDAVVVAHVRRLIRQHGSRRT